MADVIAIELELVFGVFLKRIVSGLRSTKLLSGDAVLVTVEGDEDVSVSAGSQSFAGLHRDQVIDCCDRQKQFAVKVALGNMSEWLTHPF